MARRWTPDELAYLRRTYGRYPISTLATKLTRSIKSIEIKAGREGLADRIPKGHSPLAWAHTRPCGRHWGASQSIIKAAKRDGVLRQLQHVRGRPYIAPDTWIEDWLAQRYAAPTDTAIEHVIRTWVPTRELARRLGIRPSHAASRLLHVRGRLKRIAANARRHRAWGHVGQPLYWHPTDARLIEQAWRNECQPPNTNSTTSFTTPSTTPSPSKPPTSPTPPAKASTASQPHSNASRNAGK